MYQDNSRRKRLVALGPHEALQIVLVLVLVLVLEKWGWGAECWNIAPA